MDYRQEIQRQLTIEYADKRETLFRLVGMLIGGALLYQYTEWLLSLLWWPIFMLGHIVYYFFLTTRSDAPSARDMHIACLIYIGMMMSFIWVPFVLVLQQDEGLRLIGFALFTAALIYMVRRADKPLLLTWGLIAVVVLPASTAFSWHFLGYDSFAKQVGGCFVAFAVGTYAMTSVFSARRLRIAAEENVQRNIQEQKMVAIGELAGGVAHEFNNTLTAVIGNLDLHDVVDDPFEKQMVMQEAYAAAKHAEAVVKQLLIYSRKAPSAPANLVVEDEIHRTIALSRRLVPETIELSYFPSGRELVVHADGTILMTALINLILNAAEAMPRGGAVNLTVAQWPTAPLVPMADGALLHPGEYVAITLADKGCGISADMLHKVIQPFVTSKNAGQGTGLGLPMVLGFAKDAGGGLQIDSSIRGTSVSIWLPAVPTSQQDTPKQAHRELA